jgi:hypothetical protein
MKMKWPDDRQRYFTAQNRAWGLCDGAAMIVPTRSLTVLLKVIAASNYHDDSCEVSGKS